MFVVMNRFPVNPDYAGQFETRIANRPRQVEQQPGFIRAQLLRPVQPGLPYIVLTMWQTQADFEAWVSAPDFAARHAGQRTLGGEALTGPNQIETFEVVLDSEQ